MNPLPPDDLPDGWTWERTIRLACWVIARMGYPRDDHDGIRSAANWACYWAHAHWDASRGFPWGAWVKITARQQGWLEIKREMRRGVAMGKRNQYTEPPDIGFDAADIAATEHTVSGGNTVDIEDALSTLPPRQREALALVVQGYTLPEIAPRVGMRSKGGADYLVRDARARLKLAIGDAA